MSAAYGLHGAALLDCFRGERDAVLACHQDGVRDDVPAAFWLREEIAPLEAAALDLCRGRVLDIGAGAGVHALALQRRGLDVTAIDVAPGCVVVMRERGVRKAEVADVESFAGSSFDTLLCLCNGLDKVGRLADLPRFLARMRLLLAPGGQLLADSFNLRVGATPRQRLAMEDKEQAGRYFGEVDLRFDYKGVQGAPFTVLHVDFGTLARIAGESGWSCEHVVSADGHYLARLRAR
jgi:SAM-dependent methyltransferase